MAAGAIRSEPLRCLAGDTTAVDLSGLPGEGPPLDGESKALPCYPDRAVWNRVLWAQPCRCLEPDGGSRRTPVVDGSGNIYLYGLSAVARVFSGNSSPQHSPYRRREPSHSYSPLQVGENTARNCGAL